ncbi:MAG: hypothetical protein ACUVTF_02145 [bacterium]
MTASTSKYSLRFHVRKKGGIIIRTILIICAIAALCAGYSNSEGAYGLFRTESAWNGGAGHFHIGWFVRGFSETRDVAIIGDSTGEASHGGGDMFFGLGYAITDNLALNIASAIHGDGVNYTDSEYNRASVGWGDTKLGLKLSLGSEKFAWSIGPVLSLPTGADRSTTIEQKTIQSLAMPMVMMVACSVIFPVVQLTTEFLLV